MMRKILPLLSIVAVAALATPAFAEPEGVSPHYGSAYAPVVGGVAVGTAVGVGLYNGWYSGAFAASLPATAEGAAVTGGVAGVGAVALIDSVIERCSGFHALLNLSAGQCADGVYIGDAPRRISSLHSRRVVR
jgi:hypothetical protein